MHFLYNAGHVLGVLGLAAWLFFVFVTNKKAEKPVLITTKTHVLTLVGIFGVYNIAIIIQMGFMLVPFIALVAGAWLFLKLRG
jgi:hypothetical protein